MSGSNDPNRNDEPQSQNRSGQPQSGQPQANQPQSGQPQANQPQGGQPQANQPQGAQYQQGQYGGSTGTLDKLQQPEPSSYIKGIVGVMAAAGLLLGIMVFLLGAVGGFPVLPEAVEETQQQAADAGQSQVVDDVLSSSHELLLGYLTAQIAPFIAFVMAPIFGTLAALRMTVTPRTKQLTAGVGTFVGSILFVLLVTLLASLVIPETTDFGPAASFAGGVPSGSNGPTGLGSIQFGNTLINGVLVGVLAGATAFATAYSVDNFLEG